MVLTPSNMLSLGSIASDFCLADPLDKKFSLQDFVQHKGIVLTFICNHCPYVIHIRDALIKLATYCSENDIALVAINSNDAEAYPEDNPAKMIEIMNKYNYPFPYLIDASQMVAKAYKAACTPDTYLFDHNLALVYRGKFDDSTPSNQIKPDAKYLLGAINNLLTNKKINPNQSPSIGCSIKWRLGNEPSY